MKNIGINTNCQCGQNFRETLKYISEAGFTDIMVSQSRKKPAHEFTDTIEYAKSVGLNIPMAHLDVGAQSPYFWAKGYGNREVIGWAKEGIKIFGDHGIKSAVIHPTHGDGITTILGGPNEYGLKSFCEIAEEAEKHNVTVALENLDAGNDAFLTYLFDNIKSPNLGFCYDCGHQNLYQPGQNLLKKFQGRCAAVHLHDNFMDRTPHQDWTRDAHLLPFDGKIDFKNVMKNLVPEYDGTIMLEVHRDQYFFEDKKYTHLSPAAYLHEAHTRGEKLAELN
jgi:sugar phosphate isomerase/epimerase